MRKLVWICPAKINWFLNVRRKRPDGFHGLETLFQRIDLCDELVFLPRPSGLRLVCGHPSLKTDESNLVYRAARLLEKRYRPARGVEIRLRKRIPIGAGLGGGSSDAAGEIGRASCRERVQISV